ncbi:MAG TPA: alpha/beta fold hydrolase [Casimicrobiaceae bacterium]|nr:alpha/beta fold hydrolase [Casimicrobiaceae bacterium]
MWSARSLWTINLAGLALYVFLTWDAVRTGVPVWLVVVGVPLVYFGIVVLMTCAYFFIACVFRSVPPRDVRLDARGVARLFVTELWSLTFAAYRMMFYRWIAQDSKPARAEVPVLLVHGVLCNAGVWDRLMRYLRRRGVGPLYVISYGPPLHGIDSFAEQLASRIDAVLAQTGARQVVLVTHSMGGLVTRAYVARYGASKVRRAVTIAAPHHGSVHAWLFVGACLAQMRPGNAWLDALNAKATCNPPPLACIWSWHDSMVAPQTSSRLEGAVDIPIAGVGHTAMLADRDVFALVLEQLALAGVDGASRVADVAESKA